MAPKSIEPQLDLTYWYQVPGESFDRFVQISQRALILFFVSTSLKGCGVWDPDPRGPPPGTRACRRSSCTALFAGMVPGMYRRRFQDERHAFVEPRCDKKGSVKFIRGIFPLFVQIISA